MISDIHGCFLTFRELLNKVGFAKSDELYLLGDYIDRGTRSREVLDYIIELHRQGYKIKSLKGNHEEMVFDSIELDDWTGGAEETLQSFGIKHFKELDKKYVKWLTALLPYLEKNEYIFVHAGLNFESDNPLKDKQSMSWIRNWYSRIDYDWLGKRKIIHGHTPKPKPEIEKMFTEFKNLKVMNIDNGCFMKDEKGFGNLCCLELNKMDLIFQQNID